MLSSDLTHRLLYEYECSHPLPTNHQRQRDRDTKRHRERHADVYGDQKRAPDLLKLELQAIVSCPISGGGNQTAAFCRRNSANSPAPTISI